MTAESYKKQILTWLNVNAVNFTCLNNHIIPRDSPGWHDGTYNDEIYDNSGERLGFGSNIPFSINGENKPYIDIHGAYQCYNSAVARYVLLYLNYSGMVFGNKQELFACRVPYLEWNHLLHAGRVLQRLSELPNTERPGMPPEYSMLMSDIQYFDMQKAAYLGRR